MTFLPSLFDLRGKAAVVVGGSSGIGLAISDALSEHGADVIIAARRLQVCQEAASRLRISRESKIEAVRCDITNRDDCRRLVEEATTRFGRLDVLIVSAAADQPAGRLNEISDEVWQTLLTTNVLGTVWLCGIAAPVVAAGGGGSVVLIGSASGLRGSDSYPGYALTKAALSQMVQHFTAQWAHRGVRFNCIAPSLIRTEFSASLWSSPETLKRSVASYPLGRLGEPRDVAGIAVALAAPAGGWITGQTIVIDGGMMAALGCHASFGEDSLLGSD